MNESLKRIIEHSTFTHVNGRYVYAKASKSPTKGKHFMISKDGEEITVVTEKNNLKYLDLIERNRDTYSLIALNVSVPFYSVGFLAAISNTIAKKGMNILIVSTYSKDYIMVKEGYLKKAMNALRTLGLKSNN